MENWISAIASIFSAVAAVASVVVAVLVWKAQSKQEKRSQEIALFDKRYEIYQTALKLLSIAGASSRNEKGKNSAYLTLASYLIAEYKVIEDNYIEKRNQLLCIIENAEKDISDKADMELAILDGETNLKLMRLRDQLMDEIQPARFCFDDKIYAHLSLLVHELFDYIMIIRNGSAIETERDDSALKKRVKEIRDYKVIEQMEECMSITK